MSPREDGTMPDGWVKAYIPGYGYRWMSFLAYRLSRKHFMADRRSEYRYCPSLGGELKRGPKRREIGRQG